MYFSAFPWIYLEPCFPVVSQTEEVCTDVYRYLTKPSDVICPTTAFIFHLKSNF